MLLCLVASWLKQRLKVKLTLKWMRSQEQLRLACMGFSDESAVETVT